jgi:hypothetical protein
MIVVEIKVTKSFIKSKTEFTNKGKPKQFPVIHRSMSLTGDFLMNVAKFQASLVSRSHNEYENDQHTGTPERVKDQYIAVKKLVKADKPLWPSDLLDKPVEAKWKKEGNYSFSQFQEWLSKQGVNPLHLQEMLEQAPEAKDEE